MQTQLEFQTVYGLDGVDRIRGEWNAIVAAMSQRRHLHQFAWFQSYAQYLAIDPDALRVIVAYRHGHPVAVFPLALGTRTVAGVSVRSLELPQHPHLHFGDFVFERRAENASLVVAMIDYLRDQRDSWDVLVTPNVLDDSAALFSISTRQPRFLHLEEAEGCHYLDNTPYETRLRQLSKSFRNGLRKARTMLSQESGVEFITAGDTESLSSAFDEFVGVEASGWKGRIGTAIRADRRLMGFYRSLIDGFTPTGGVRINLLRVGGQCIAGQFCLKVDRSLYNLKIGYREDFSRLSPGNMLLEHVLKRELATGDVDAVDLITGASWQRHWRPQTRKLFTAYAFNRTLRGGMSFRISRAKEHLRPTYQRYIKPLLPGQARRASEVRSEEV